MRSFVPLDDDDDDDVIENETRTARRCLLVIDANAPDVKKAGYADSNLFSQTITSMKTLVVPHLQAACCDYMADIIRISETQRFGFFDECLKQTPACTCATRGSSAEAAACDL